MKKITGITVEQQARFGEWAQKWIDIGLSTEPADFDMAIAAALKGYELANLKKPMVILRLSSPYAATMGGALAWMMLREMKLPVRAQVGDQVRAQVRAQVGDQVWAQLPKFSAEGRNNDYGGSLLVGFSAWVSFIRDVLGWDGDTLPKFQVYEDLSKSCGWVWWHQNVCAISDRPEYIGRDSAGRLHSETGMAIRYRDGWGFHCWHGVRVPGFIIDAPETITIQHIRDEQNAEVRRVMIERMGYDRYVAEAGLSVVDACAEDHKLIGLRTARLLSDNDGLTLLDMLNSTPEPDGTVKRYIIAVDPDAYNGRAGRECLAAMASTWRRESDMSLVFASPEHYLPMAES